MTLTAGLPTHLDPNLKLQKNISFDLLDIDLFSKEAKILYNITVHALPPQPDITDLTNATPPQNGTYSSIRDLQNLNYFTVLIIVTGGTFLHNLPRSRIAFEHTIPVLHSGSNFHYLHSVDFSGTKQHSINNDISEQRLKRRDSQKSTTSRFVQ